MSKEVPMKKYAALFLGVAMLALSAIPASGKEAPYYEFSLGSAQIQVLSLVEKDLKAAILQPGTEAQRTAIARAYPEGNIRNFLNVLLLRGNGIVALVDTGFVWTGAELDAALRHAGITPEDITHVVLTHAHSDHVGGLLREGQPSFPKAKILFSRKELAYWTNPANRAAASEGARKIFQEMDIILREYGDRVSGIEPETDIWKELPGIQAVDEAGHTPGHIGIRVTGDNKTFVFWADLLHAFAVQADMPSLSSDYDMDPAAAAQKRTDMLRQARAEGWLITGSHMPFVQPRALTTTTAP